MKYFEDFAVADEFDSRNTYRVSAEEIRDFARTWDPWPYHLDEDQAKQTLVGRLFAPSALSFCISVRLAHDTAYYEISTVAGLGIDDLRMPKPVLPDDDLRLKVTIVDMRDSKSRPRMGIVVTKVELLNQSDEIVLSYRLSGLVNRRPQAGHGG